MGGADAAADPVAEQDRMLPSVWREGNLLPGADLRPVKAGKRRPNRPRAHARSMHDNHRMRCIHPGINMRGPQTFPRATRMCADLLGVSNPRQLRDGGTLVAVGASLTRYGAGRASHRRAGDRRPGPAPAVPSRRRGTTASGRCRSRPRVNRRPSQTHGASDLGARVMDRVPGHQVYVHHPGHAGPGGGGQHHTRRYGLAPVLAQASPQLPFNGNARLTAWMAMVWPIAGAKHGAAGRPMHQM